MAWRNRHMSSTNRNRRNAYKDEEEASLLMEQKNNAMIEDLQKKTSMLLDGGKDLSKLIKEDERRMNEIGGLMGDASGLLSQSMGKFNDMLETGGTKTTCYLACFIFVVFLIFYWILSR